ncbi:MAG TPA: 2-C-methyl-D-erythritol 4-phosphate cytidylyltransferase [Myxococcota bacterium]|nr:2-C-methyl-D-erythritol 4-phosphate cytidylyltransferase [Myxococcota bacterium]
MRVVAIAVAAGRGERLGHALPKAFVALRGRTLLGHAVAALAASDRVDGVLPVLPSGMDPPHDAANPKLLRAVAGGERRQDSVAAGLAALPDGVEYVAVHDAARALVRTAAVTRVIDAAVRHGAALLAVPARDTIKRVRAGVVVETPPRDECFAAQTPQVFRIGLLREALDKARAEGRTATDCAQLVEALGVRVHVVEGDPDNWKITDPSDLAAAERVLEAR